MALAAIGDKGYEGAYNQPRETVLCVWVAGVYVPKLYKFMSRKKCHTSRKKDLNVKLGPPLEIGDFNLFDLLKGFWDVPNTVDPNSTPNKIQD